MNELAFFDTNVLVYADDASSPEKQKRSIALFAEHLRSGTAVVSLQVLQEYFAAVTRKLKVAPDLAQRKVEIIARSRVVRFDSKRRDCGHRAPSAYTSFVLGRLDRSRRAVRGRGCALYRGPSARSCSGRGSRSQSVRDLIGIKGSLSSPECGQQASDAGP